MDTPQAACWRTRRCRTALINGCRARFRMDHSFSSSTFCQACSMASRVLSQLPLPQYSVQSASAAAESHDGICTPLVTWPMGISCCGQRENRGLKIRRLTSPCKRLTPFALPQPRRARFAMLKESRSSSSACPRARRASIETPRLSA